MVDPAQPLRTHIVPIGRVAWSPTRRSEPVTIGIPIPSGVARSAAMIGLEDRHGRSMAVQVRPLDHWPDGSIRWALVDCRVDAVDGASDGVTLRLGEEQQTVADHGLRVNVTTDSIRIETGQARFGFSVGGVFPISEVIVGDDPSINIAESGLRIEHDGRALHCRISEVSLDDSGPLRVAVEIRGVLDDSGAGLPLDVFARVEAFSASATIRIAVTIRNHRRATHSQGFWTLGDTGSVSLDSAVLKMTLAEPVSQLRVAPECGEALGEAQLPFEIHQESSGGDNWNRPTHSNRDGQVSLRFRGYRRRDGQADRMGLRATPIVVAETSRGSLSVAMPKFWQNFPRAITVRDNQIEIAFFPRHAERLELQGGEQKTHVVVVSFAPDSVSDPALAWVHDPQLIYPSPEWCCESGAVPFLVTAEKEQDTEHLALVQAAATGFLSKREAADEYGWRHFGDVLADHESAFRPAGELLVSHYNNQYDAIACFAVQFLRTGDPRWWDLMMDLARHVRDIDIYHTEQDKAAYNGGLFWHTYHYCDAGTSTHRSYPQNGPASGGPSAEHNYNVGLMLHYFMTGEAASRTEAINLGRWAVAMDDGRLTIFRWLARGPTGLASGSGSASYHGPGRGAANSILACLVAYRLTRDKRFEAKIDELLRRCINPSDDIEARNLFDVELRWFYTIFLQVLGYYLQDKAASRSYDDGFFYARESLLHYARWMAEHERPYLDHPEKLEYPNETWAAQDLRKADVLLSAAWHTDGSEREAFVRRAAFFRETSVKTLLATPKHRYTRPTVLVLSNAVRFAWYENAFSSGPGHAILPAPATRWPKSPAFETQRARALRRAAGLAATLGLAVIAGATYLVAGW